MSNRLHQAFRGAAAVFGLDFDQAIEDIRKSARKGEAPACPKLEPAGLKCGLHLGHKGPCEPVVEVVAEVTDAGQ